MGLLILLPSQLLCHVGAPEQTRVEISTQYAVNCTGQTCVESLSVARLGHSTMNVSLNDWNLESMHTGNLSRLGCLEDSPGLPLFYPDCSFQAEAHQQEVASSFRRSHNANIFYSSIIEARPKRAPGDS